MMSRGPYITCLVVAVALGRPGVMSAALVGWLGSLTPDDRVRACAVDSAPHVSLLLALLEREGQQPQPKEQLAGVHNEIH